MIDLGRVPALEGVDVQPGQKGMLFPRCVRHNVPEHDICLSHGVETMVFITSQFVMIH